MKKTNVTRCSRPPSQETFHLSSRQIGNWGLFCTKAMTSRLVPICDPMPAWPWRQTKKKKELLWFSQRTIMTLALRVLKNLSSSWTRRRKNSSCGSMWCQWHVLLLSLTSGSHFQKRSRPIIIAWPLLNEYNGVALISESRF